MAKFTGAVLDFRVIHTRDTRPSQRGIWKGVFERLTDVPDNEDAMLDSTIVHSHQLSAGANGGILNRKRSDAATVT